MKKNRLAMIGAYAGLPIAVGSLITAAFADLPPVPVPVENPITESKRVLGKILFFDEQLSSTNTVSCATCHVMNRAGSDPRRAVNAGPDQVTPSPDDIFASPGVVASDAASNYLRDPIFGVLPQVTGRAANSPINAAYAIDAFWDGRARSQFVDPQTGQVAIANGGALESQSVNPPASSVEMAHQGIDWTQIIAKLNRVNPLDLATSIPPDVAAQLTTKPNYGELFRRAFGDTQITSRRIAFAIATYERTLLSNQTPWDAFVGGNQGALTPAQARGLGTFNARCNVCHTAPVFSGQTFRNIGIRPPAEDLGRQIVTGNPADRGRFKVPSLRNVGLKNTFMHNGQFTQLQQVIDFYSRANGAPPPFLDNLDPAFPPPGSIPGPARADLDDFVRNALTDPRVAAQTFPFDRVTLFTDPARAADRSTNLNGGVAGTGGIIPRIILPEPAMVGNVDYRIGLDGALGNATATLGISTVAPVNGQITPTAFIGTATAAGSGAGQGLATVHWPLNPGVVVGGQVLFMQWFVGDPGAVGGTAKSQVFRVPVFCGSYGCPVTCYPNCDNSTSAPVLTANDFQCFLGKFAIGDATANCDGSTVAPTLTANDFQCYLNAFAKGCP